MDRFCDSELLESLDQMIIQTASSNVSLLINEAGNGGGGIFDSGGSFKELIEGVGVKWGLH